MYAITPKERLQQYARYKFGTMKAMEVHCGLVNGQIGNNSGLNVTTVQKILEACPELNPDWLILGAGPMERGKPVEKPAGIKLRQDGIEIVTAPTVATANEPTQPYKSIKREKDEMVTIPSSILDALRQQLENKDAQIATLLQVINNTK
jgi:hypothetical protein